MARAGWRKPESLTRLSDVVSVGLLMRVFPPDLVDEVIAECDRTELRSRSLPARVMAYFAMGMALHLEGSYEDVLALMTDGLGWAGSGSGGPVKLPSKSAIFQARDRLGAEPLKGLFDRVARPLATGRSPHRRSHASRTRPTSPAGHAGTQNAHPCSHPADQRTRRSRPCQQHPT